MVYVKEWSNEKYEEEKNIWICYIFFLFFLVLFGEYVLKVVSGIYKYKERLGVGYVWDISFDYWMNYGFVKIKYKVCW